MKTWLVGLLFLFTSLSAWSQSKNTGIVQHNEIPVYTVGTGAKYFMTKGSDKSEISIVFVESTKESLVVEMFMKSLSDRAALQVEMVQQFQFKMVGGTLQLIKGIMKIPHLPKPQIIPAEALAGVGGGAQLKSFLIGSKAEIDAQKVADETVTENGKSYRATHYKKSENGQNIEYWVSDDAKPLGFVRMKSTGANSMSNYTMNYIGPLSAVKSKIDATQAEPMSDAALMLVPLLLDGMKSK